MNVNCVQYTYCNEYGPIAKVTALINKDIALYEAKQLIVKEILGNYTVDNKIHYTSKLERQAISDTQDVLVGELTLNENYTYKDIEDFHILDFHKLKGWNLD